MVRVLSPGTERDSRDHGLGPFRNAAFKGWVGVCVEVPASGTISLGDCEVGSAFETPIWPHVKYGVCICMSGLPEVCSPCQDCVQGGWPVPGDLSAWATGLQCSWSPNSRGGVSAICPSPLGPRHAAKGTAGFLGRSRIPSNFGCGGDVSLAGGAITWRAGHPLITDSHIPRAPLWTPHHLPAPRAL